MAKNVATISDHATKLDIFRTKVDVAYSLNHPKTPYESVLACLMWALVFHGQRFTDAKNALEHKGWTVRRLGKYEATATKNGAEVTLRRSELGRWNVDADAIDAEFKE